MYRQAEPIPLPPQALLQSYARSGAYTDCYALDVDGAVARRDYVRAFYTSPLFKVERFILRWVVRKPSTDTDAALLATDETDHFAAWSVEDRETDQLLLCDYQGRTRSWLMTEPLDGARTRLYFGSAVVPIGRHANGNARMGVGFTLLLGFHRLYSRALLRSARANLPR